MKIDVQTLDGKKSGSLDLSKDIFGQEPRKDILHRMVRYQLAKRQSGTHQLKNVEMFPKQQKELVARRAAVQPVMVMDLFLSFVVVPRHTGLVQDHMHWICLRK